MILVSKVEQNIVIEIYFVHKYKLTWDWERRVVRIGVKRHTNFHAPVVLTETITIPAYQDYLFFGYVKPGVADGEIGAISGCPWKLCWYRVGIVNILCSVHRGRVPLRFLNPGN